MAEDKKEWLDWSRELKEFQESDLDQRDQARESDRFILDKDGQWEEHVAQVLDSQKRPRYTFDQVTPVIENYMADIEDMDFAVNVKPAGGQATKELALTFEGMVRAIEADSSAVDLYRSACRRIIRRGFDAWIVKADYKDNWSFEQDLFITPIVNAINRVWVSNTCQKEDSSDSDVAYVMTSLSPEAYKEQFPEGSGISVCDADLNECWDDYKPEVITIGERYYRKEVTIEVALLSDGSVVEVDDKFEKVQDELLAQGVRVEKTKRVKDSKFYHRFFDGGGMLSEERETPFRSNPVVTVYGNYEHLGESSKIKYSGLVLKEMDYQRVFNYAKSREVEEGALAPREKIWMTKKQAKGHQDKLAAMNVSADPVQFYNPDPDAPQGPYKTGPSQINPHLATLSQAMSDGIQRTAGVNNAMTGEMAARMSEQAMLTQIDRGTGGTRKWVNALVRGIRRTGEILVEAIPVVYDTKRQFSVMNIDGSEDQVILNEEVFDQQSQQMVKINNLNQGKYKVFSDAGPAFHNREEAGRAALLEYAALDPTVVQMSGDVMLKSIDAPMVDQIAERKRATMVQQGVIPVEQLTDDEKEKLAAQAQQPKLPDANMVLAQAEVMKGQADLLAEQNRRTELQIKAAELQQKGYRLGIDEQKAAADIGNTNADTIKKLAEAEKTSGESIGQQIDNAQKVMPQVTVVTQQ